MTARTMPGLGLLSYYDLGEDGWKDGMDENLRTLSAVAQLAVLSRVTALPGSPTDGDIYIVPSGGEANNVAVRDNGAWVYLTPAEGWRAWVADEDTLVVWNGTGWVTPGLRVNTQSGTSYTLVAGDAASYVRMNNASANTLTVPQNSSVGFPIGTQIPVNQAGAGQTTIVADSGVTINSPATLKLRAQRSSAALIKVAANEWDLSGDLETA